MMNVKGNLTVSLATQNEAEFVKTMFELNQKKLNAEFISLSEWQEILGNPDPYEKHFLICKKSMPVAYIKINGLENKDTAYVSMLFVHCKYQRQGIGSFALDFAQQYVFERGFSHLAIKTDKENLQAQHCYEKNGFILSQKRGKYLYIKPIK